MSERIEITRYPNRRLYDRSQKKYVTLGDIEELVFNGRDVRVRDSKSNSDLTRVILTQIIMERHPERLRLFPAAFLHAILRADHLAMDWLTAYFGQAMSSLEKVTGSSPPTFTPGIELWRSLMPGANAASAAGTEEGEEAADGTPVVDLPPAPDDSELAVRLAEMERRLKQLEAEQSEN